MRTSFRMEDKYISMIRGDTLSFGIELLDENGEVFTQDLDTANFTVKSNKNDSVNVVRKSLNNGITKVGEGQYTVRVAPEDTKDLESGKYFYDLQIGVNDDIFSVMHGVLELEQDVTY